MKTKTLKKIILASSVLLNLFIIYQCKFSNSENKFVLQDRSQKKRIGIVLANHGSRSETWRNALLDLEKKVRDSLMKIPNVVSVATAFMEYTEPSIATQVAKMDSIGCSDVIIIPVFLTVSPHTFEDIPTILGLKEDPESLELLKIENIKRYFPKSRVHITPLLDFTDLLKKNILRRVKNLSQKPEEEGLVLIGYGDQRYLKEWENLFDEVGKFIKDSLKISEYSYGWCGHLVHYNPEETTKAIHKVLQTKEKAIVIPVLVAHDEMFQIKIIGGGIEKIKDYQQRVKYKPDAILPDSNVEDWIYAITNKYVEEINKSLSNTNI